MPGNEKHVAYVWLDALTNYISALEFAKNRGEGVESEYTKFWPADLHIVGKDILRFHCIFWPAFLMAAGLLPPKRVFAHGWWTRDGEKMSKSVGNVVEPFALVERYGKDYVRYFMVAEVPFGNDGDFSDDGFAMRINSDLANDIGNLAQRALTMLKKHCEGKLPVPGQVELPQGLCEANLEDVLTEDDRELLRISNEAAATVKECMSRQQLKPACEAIINISKAGNRYIDVQAPWSLRKTDVARMHTVLYVLVESVRRVAILLQPIMPDSSHSLLLQLGAGDATMQSLRSFGTYLPPGTPIGAVEPVFPRIEREEGKKGSGGQGEQDKTKQMSKKEKVAAENARLLAMAKESYGSLSFAEVEALIAVTGEEIRSLKASEAEKDEVQRSIDKLVGLKLLLSDMTSDVPAP